MEGETPMDADAVGHQLDVSRETLSRLKVYVDNLVRWQKRINLVGPATIADVWRRHILDSGQLCAFLPQRAQRIIDLGSGAGFPGLVIAIMLPASVTLVESDRRKAMFLKETARLVGATNVEVRADRIESLDIEGDVVTARALAPLDRLIGYSQPMLSPQGYCLFLKGQEFEREIEEARRTWRMRVELMQSVTNSSSRILKIDEVSRVHG